MKGDFSRLGFDPARRQRYVRLLLQQGRVQLDSDFNEQQAISERLRRRGLATLAGAVGAPTTDGGFAVGVTPAGDDLSVSGGTLLIDGLICTTEPVTLRRQPNLAADPWGTGTDGPPPAGRYLVYLDAWEQHVTALDDPTLREPALGGPDTATRTRLITQVKLLAVAGTADSSQFGPGWSGPAPEPVGTLAAGVAEQPAERPCYLPPDAGYTALANQLYRVEIHDGGAFPPPAGAPAPTWKWSRDNGLVTASVTAISGTELTLSTLGPDEALGFRPLQHVELLSRSHELAGRPGEIATIAAIVPERSVVALPAVVAAATSEADPLLIRRWDQPSTGPDVIDVTAGPLPLEEGIVVRFGPGVYRTGMYWTIPARTAIDAATGAILWPDGKFLPPEGIEHAYAALALVDRSPTGFFTLVEDCRVPLVPLAGRLPMRAQWRQFGKTMPLASGGSVPFSAIDDGLVLSAAVALDPTRVGAHTVELVVQVPTTLGDVIPGGGDQLVGSRAVTLACGIALAAPGKIEVRPDAGALTMLSRAITRPLLSATQTDFARSFGATSVGKNPAWIVKADGTVSQTVAGAGTDAALPVQPKVLPKGFAANARLLADGTAPFPALALASQPPPGRLAHAGLGFRLDVPADCDVGLIFNYLSNRDFWLFYVSKAHQVVGFSGAFARLDYVLAHLVDGQLAGDQQMVSAKWSADGQVYAAELDVTEGNGLRFGVVLRRADGVEMDRQQIAFGTAAPKEFIAGGLIGMMTRGAQATFTRLQGTTRNDINVPLVPLGRASPVQARLRARRAQMAPLGEPRFGTLPSEPDFEIGFLITADGIGDPYAPAQSYPRSQVPAPTPPPSSGSSVPRPYGSRLGIGGGLL